MSKRNRTLRVAVGTALFAIGACQKDKAATETPEPEAAETTNVGPTGEPTEKANVGPEEAAPPESTNVSPTGEPQPTANPAPVTPKQ